MAIERTAISTAPCLAATVASAQDCESRVERVIANHSGTEREKVTNDVDICEDLGADSLDAVEITMALEEEFDKRIPGDVTASPSVANFAQFICK